MLAYNSPTRPSPAPARMWRVGSPAQPSPEYFGPGQPSPKIVEFHEPSPARPETFRAGPAQPKNSKISWAQPSPAQNLGLSPAQNFRAGLARPKIFRAGLGSPWATFEEPWSWCYKWCTKQHNITVAGFQQKCCFSATNVVFSLIFRFLPE